MSVPRLADVPFVGIAVRPWEGVDLNRVGVWGLMLLAATLPLEMTQRPLTHSGLLTLTSLKLEFYLLVALAMVSLGRRFRIRPWDGRIPLPVLFWLGLIAVATLSSALSPDRSNGLKWTFDLALGGILWLAIPLWTIDEDDRRAIALALVAGGVLAAGIGLIEIWRGPGFDAALAAFKSRPTMVGPYLRLSGTFEYANIAGGYLAMVLPFVVAACAAWRGWMRSAAAAAAVVMGAALLLTYSRGAAMALGVGLAVMLVAVRGRYGLGSLPRIAPWAVGLALAAALLAGAVAMSLTPFSLRLTTESDLAWYRASFGSQVPSSMPTGALLRLPVRVHNDGPITWRSAGANPFYLSYHWLRPSGRVAIYDGVRTALPHPVTAGGTETVLARVLTPRHSGQYRLVWDMVLEHVTWFGTKTGRYAAIPVTVHGALAAQSQPVHLPPVRVTTLPAAPPQPERRALWGAALRMIQSHPLLGVGPDGFRLQYGRFAVPPLRVWDRHVLANSLLLELGANLGLVGLALFVGLMVTALRSAFVTTVRGRVWSLWQAAAVAAIAVFLAQGVVDYLLGSHAVFIAFWILLGLVAGIRPATGEAR